MDLSTFDYHLPPESIAQIPAHKRDESRLLIADRKENSFQDCLFRDVVDLLHPGDVLVINDTHVFPARLFGKKEPGGAAIEMLLLESLEDGEWHVIAYRASRLKKGTRVIFSNDFSCEVRQVLTEGKFVVRFSWKGDWDEALTAHGQIPLPPYIERENEPTSDEQDRERYQTVYARKQNPYDSAAAPTAGLHFTPDLLSRIREKGIHVCPLTLRVGLDTFLPIRTDQVESHRMHSESYFLPEETAYRIEEAIGNGNRVIPVGTTSMRVLEAASPSPGKLIPGEGVTDLFIYPGYSFKIVNSAITNFHLPRTTLLLLVSALMGIDTWRSAYEYAIQHQFRFYSYGDAMLIL